MSDLKKLTEEIIAFRDARDWHQFHKPKDVAISLALEAGEVLEHFQWKTDADVKAYIEKNREALGEELGDVLNYLLILANEAGIDLEAAFRDKITKNNKKYPVEKAKGRPDKYTAYL